MPYGEINLVSIGSGKGLLPDSTIAWTDIDLPSEESSSVDSYLNIWYINP